MKIYALPFQVVKVLFTGGSLFQTGSIFLKHFRWWSSLLKFYFNMWKIRNAPKTVFQKMQNTDVFCQWNTMQSLANTTFLAYRLCFLSNRFESHIMMLYNFSLCWISHRNFRQHRWKVEVTVEWHNFSSLPPQ